MIDSPVRISRVSLFSYTTKQTKSSETPVLFLPWTNTDLGTLSSSGSLLDKSATIKSLVSRYMTTFDNPRWVDVFQDLITNYNKTENRATNLAPKEVTSKKEIKINKAARKQYNEEVGSLTKNLEVGDNVRIPSSKAKFDKEGQTYSNTIYQVESIIGSKVQLKNPDGHVLKTKYNINVVLKVPDGSKTADTTKIKTAKKRI